MSGRSAAWLARLVRDQEVEGSNPFAPTIFSPLDSIRYTLAAPALSPFPLRFSRLGALPILHEEGPASGKKSRPLWED